ncbi:Serpin-4 [Operophtera brumata]|uniref:Serpin-4 n=1 Tax=Operophtera brumata TaxID=104452 RepID=A0A0L7LHE9_OPEBR|nr:Serpin-4 [Operophtera brumata]
MNIVLFVLFCSAVCNGQPIQNATSTTVTPASGQETNTSRVRNRLTEAIGNFSIEFLFKTSVLQVPGQNMIISPITVWTALAVIAEGASDDTKTEIIRALRLSRNQTATRENFGDIAKWLTVNTKTVEIAKFNGIFVDKLRLPLPEFQSTSKIYYDTDTVALNLSNPVVTADLLNRVISNFTHGRISSIVQSDNLQNTPMVLASALYFKGQWTVPFNTTSTSKQPFYDSNGTQIGEVNMMYNRAIYPFSNIKWLQARVIELPYGEQNRLSMLVMLPNHGVSLESMFSNFKNVHLDSFFEELRLSKEEFSEDEVDCFIPRFKIKSDLDLTEVLKQQMGVQQLFDMSKARLPKISHTPLYVSKLVHKAEIEVTEEGTTASAVTVAEFSNRIGVVRFEANRPFTYMIVERLTNTIVFGGFYRQPSLY